MHVAVFSIFAASKKEPLVTTLERVHIAFIEAGLGEPSVRFGLSDHVPITQPAVLAEIKGMTRVSSVARVLRHLPELERFARDTAEGRGMLSNLTPSGMVQPVEFGTLLEIARGVPKSFPFHKALFHFAAPGFSDGPEMPPVMDRQTIGALMRAGVDIGAGHPTTAGISVQDAWWVNGRQRSMAALRIVEPGPSAKKIPAPPAAIAALLAACGKVRKTTQLPVVVKTDAPHAAAVERIDAEISVAGQAIRSVVRAWRGRMPELIARLPHDLPHQEDTAAAPMTATSGPKKPELVRAFAPMGYDCRGETGTFRLRRRTAGHLIVELELDVGTWSNSLMAFFRVQGLIDGQGFKATINLPVSPSAARGLVHGVELAGQFPIGGPERWSRIVDNLAVLVAELDRGFVPEIEAASGPSPEWYQPTSG